MDRDAIRRHIEAVYTNWDSGTFVLFPKDTKATERFDAAEPGALDRMADRAAALAVAGRDVHFGVQVMRTGLGTDERPYERGGLADVHAVTGFISDVDTGKDRTPATKAEARRFIADALPRPTLLVDSGGGYHTYYLLEEPYLIETEAERAMLSGMAKGVALLVNRHAESRGWIFDQQVGELARVLRPAGALHLKDLANPRPVTMVDASGPRYTLEGIQELLPADLGAPACRTNAPDEGGKPLEDHRRDALLRAFVGAWRDGQRHHMALYTAGFLANAGYAESAVATFVALASSQFGDRDPDGKQDAVRDSYALLRRGLRPAGFSELAPLLTEDGRGILRTFFPLSNGVTATFPATATAAAEPTPPDTIARRPFPVDCLPAALRELAIGAESTLGIPADYVATAGLTVIATAAGNALELEIKRGWKERPQLWAGIIGNPGTTKSPAIDIAARPLSDLQAQKRQEWSEAYQEWAETLKAERGPAPQLEIVEATDSTIEGLARALEHSRGVLAKADELTSWIAGHNRYRGSNASERGEYLKLWAGGNITAVRSTRVPLVITRPMAALIGGIQPARLVALAGDRPGEFVNDGMLDRFLVAWPDARPAVWTEDEMSPGIIEGWGQLVTDLRAWKPVYTTTETGYDVVRLTPDAKRLWQRWHDSNIDSIETAHGLTRGWASKAPRHLLRLCLVLHAATNPSEPYRDVPVETLEAAIELVEWFREQHGLMLSALNVGTASATAGLTGRIMRAIERSETHRLSRAELLRTLGNVRAPDLTAALDTLTTAGELAITTVTTASKPREEYSYPVEQFELSNNLMSDANEKVRKFESSNQVQNEITRPVDETAIAPRCVDCGAPVQMRGLSRCDACVQAHYERTYGAPVAVQREPLFAAGEPGLDRFTQL